jgi:hypothetical protein
MSSKKQQLAIIHSIPDEYLDRAIKAAAKIFSFDDVSVDFALEHNRPKKLRFLSVVPDVDDPAKNERFFKVVSKFVDTAAEDTPAPRRAAAKAAAPVSRKTAARKVVAKAAAPAKRTRETEAEVGTGKIVIAADAEKLAEALAPNKALATKGATILCTRGTWSAEAVQGKGVIIKGIGSSNIAGPLGYLRNRLGGTPFLRKARVYVELTEAHAARAGLTLAKDGTYMIEE